MYCLTFDFDHILCSSCWALLVPGNDTRYEVFTLLRDLYHSSKGTTTYCGVVDSNSTLSYVNYLFLICSSSWVTCDAVPQRESFLPVFMPASHIIVRPALAQAKQDHLILLGDTEQLQLSLFPAKTTVKRRKGCAGFLVSKATVLTCCLNTKLQTFSCHSHSYCQLLQLSS